MNNIRGYKVKPVYLDEFLILPIYSGYSTKTVFIHHIIFISYIAFNSVDILALSCKVLDI